MPWRSRRYDWTSVPDIQQSTVGEFVPISVTWPSWSVPRKRTSRDEALMPATGGKRAFGGAGLNTAPDPKPTLRTSASEQSHRGI